MAAQALCASSALSGLCSQPFAHRTGAPGHVASKRDRVVDRGALPEIPAASCTREYLRQAGHSPATLQELIEAVHLLETVHTDNTHLKGSFQQVRRARRCVRRPFRAVAVAASPNSPALVQLKSFYEELVDAHQALKGRYAELQEERDAVESQYQQLCDGWRVELEGKQAAFDEARSQVLSQR